MLFRVIFFSYYSDEIPEFSLYEFWYEISVIFDISIIDFIWISFLTRDKTIIRNLFSDTANPHYR
jgi:hypothetical protein